MSYTDLLTFRETASFWSRVPLLQREVKKTMLPVFTVLASTTDKTGLVELLLGMREIDPAALEIISTGGTMRELVAAGLKVTPIEELTRNPEGMDDRVKTLSVQTAAGLLWAGPQHDEYLTMVGTRRIHMYVGNLYKFSEAAANAQLSHSQKVSQIDIGGPTNWRALAKNYMQGIVLSNPSQYPGVLARFRSVGQLTVQAVPEYEREELAGAVFKAMREYDGAIDDYFERRRVARLQA